MPAMSGDSICIWGWGKPFYNFHLCKRMNNGCYWYHLPVISMIFVYMHHLAFFLMVWLLINLFVVMSKIDLNSNLPHLFPKMIRSFSYIFFMYADYFLKYRFLGHLLRFCLKSQWQVCELSKNQIYCTRNLSWTHWRKQIINHLLY